jgi:hypothetical protein
MRLVRDADDRGQRLVIDCPSFNPLDEADMKRCSDLISHMNVEPILVIGADGHPMEIEDNARAFAQAGCRRVILTRIDAVRRRGGAIAAISSAPRKSQKRTSSRELRDDELRFEEVGRERQSSLARDAGFRHRGRLGQGRGREDLALHHACRMLCKNGPPNASG